VQAVEALPQLTVVCGPSGAGKSHLMRATVRSDRTITVSMRDLYDGSELPPLLVQALKSRVPSMPGWLSAAVGPTCGPVSDTAPLRRFEQLGALLGQELHHHLHRPTTLIVDELERADADLGAMRFIETIVRTAPAALSIVLITRTDIPFSVKRLRADDRVLEIGPSDLVVDDAELRSLVLDRWPDLDQHADAVVEMSMGRPGLAVTCAACLAASIPEERAAVVAELRSSDDLERTATDRHLDALDHEHRLLLDDLAVFGRATADELGRVGHHDAAKLLPALVEAGLVDRSEPVSDRVRPSRRVETILRPAGERAAEVGGVAVHAALGRGDATAAIRVAVRSGDDRLVADTVTRFGAAAIDAGGGQLVLDTVDRLADPALSGTAGRAAQALGDWNRATAEYERAAAVEVHAGDAWRHGLIAHFRGDIAAAGAAYRRGIEQARPDDDPGELARLLGYGGAISWLAGDVEAARTNAERSLELATSVGDDGALAVAYTLAAMVAASDGDRVSNDWHYVRALQHAERAPDLLQIARIRSNRGSRLMEEGDYEAALDELDEAVRYAEAGGFDGMLALALTNRGEVAIKLGRLDDAGTDLSVAAELLQRHGTPMVAYPLVQLARLFTIRGDLEQARGACERALALTTGADDLQIEVAALNQLATTLATIDPAMAWHHAQRATSIAPVSLDAAEAWAILARLAAARGEPDDARRAAERSAELARSRRDRYVLGVAVETQAMVESDAPTRRRLLDEAFNLFDELGCPVDSGRVELHLAELRLDALAITRVAAVAEQARRLGARPLLAQADDLLDRHDASPGAALAVAALGTFSVSLNGEPIPAKRWQSKKARDLFKMLVCLRGRPLPRDLALERLWPDDDPAKASSKLSVALATMRSVLDPDKEHAADHYVRAEGDAIVLDPATVPTDIDQFLSGASAALAELRRHRGDRNDRAVAMLAAVEARYQGDVFEDDPYVDWFVPLREEARAVYLNVTRELATIRAAAGELDDAIRLYLRLLEREPYDETAHVDLVRALSTVGRHGDARRRYQRYADRMRELDLEPRSFAAVVDDD
jgi:DNA-binding SARP family transcriptional activator/ATP/maltotriose-dependent transcriptional regulator MalT